MKKGNFIVVLCVSILILISLITQLTFQYFKKSSESLATISVYGKIKKQVDLNKISDPIEFTIENGKGGYNIIRIEKGKIGIVDANCPDKLCVKKGSISTGPVPIVCLPHGLIIEISGDSSLSNEIDTLSE